MEHLLEVKSVLGPENVRLLLEEIRCGRLKQQTVKFMALLMGGGVHGVFEQKKDQFELVDLMRLLLDSWYTEEIYKYKAEDGLSKLIEILNNEDVGLHSLAHKMTKPVKPVNISKEELFVELNFKPDYYILDKNDDESFLGRG